MRLFERALVVIFLLLMVACASTRTPSSTPPPPPSPMVSVFSLPIRVDQPAGNLTRLPERAQTAIINRLAEMTEQNPSGFLETISSPVFQGDSAESIRDLSRQNLRLVLTVLDPSPDFTNALSRVQITLSPATESDSQAGPPFSFVAWNRFASRGENIDLGELRFTEREKPANSQPSVGNPDARKRWWRRKPPLPLQEISAASATVSLAPGDLRIASTMGGLNNSPSSFVLDTEIDLGPDRKDIVVASPVLRPSSSKKDGETEVNFEPGMRLQTWRIPRVRSLYASVSLEARRKNGFLHSPGKSSILLIREDDLDFKLWQAVGANGGKPVGVRLGNGDDPDPLFFASAKAASDFLALINIKETPGYDLDWPDDSYYIRPVWTRELFH